MNIKIEKAKTNKMKKTNHIPQKINQIQKKNMFHFILHKGINNIGISHNNFNPVKKTEIERLQSNALLYSNISRIR